MTNDSSDKHFAHAVTISIEALKAMLLVNGGSATALIALQAKGGADFALPVLLFGLAAFFNATTFVVGYRSQLAYANHRLSHELGDTVAAQDALKWHGRCQIAAMAMVFASLIASGAGIGTAFLQIERTPHLAAPQK